MSDFSRSTSVQRNVEILSREIEGEAVLLDPEEGTYFALNDTGTVIWNKLAEKTTLGTMMEQIMAEYEVGEEQLWREMTTLLGEMRERKLIEVE